MLKRTATLSLLVGLAFGGSALAQTNDAECPAAAECPTAKKVDALLANWETVAEQSKSVTPEQRQQLGAKVADRAQQCPVGSRLGGALSAVDDVLAFVVASSEANAKYCPIEKADASLEGYAEAKELKAARTSALGKLSKLASFAAGATCSEAAACTGAEGCTPGDACDKAATSCPIRIASRVGELKASFVVARQEASALSSEARGKLMAGFATMSETHPAVALVPPSVSALTEGFEVLSKLQGQMMEWAMAHPEIVSSVPEEAHRAFMLEAALLDEARGLLANVTAAMQSLQAPATKTAMAGSR